MPARPVEGFAQSAAACGLTTICARNQLRRRSRVLMRGARVAVGAAVQPATVWIDAELETEIRTVIVGKDLFGLVLEDRELDARRVVCGALLS